MELVDEAVYLAKRSGAVSHIVGVGSGAALDCAKAVSSILSCPDDDVSSCSEYIQNMAQNTYNGDNNATNSGKHVRLTLAPTTLGAVMASMSNSSLLLDPHEEALIPCPLLQHIIINDDDTRLTDDTSSSVNTTGVNVSVTLDSSQLYTSEHNRADRSGEGGMGASIQEAALASLAICLDDVLFRIHSGNGNDQNYVQLVKDDPILHAALESVKQVLTAAPSNDAEESNNELMQRHAISACLHAGQLLRFGVHGNQQQQIPRSMPIALASALLPRYFPHGNLLTFWAATASGMCAATAQNSAYQDHPALMDLTEFLIADTAENDDHTYTLSDLYEWTRTRQKKESIVSLAGLAEGAPDVGAMCGALDSNRALLGDLDAPYDLLLEDIVRYSLNQ